MSAEIQCLFKDSRGTTTTRGRWGRMRGLEGGGGGARIVRARDARLPGDVGERGRALFGAPSGGERRGAIDQGG